MRPWQFVALTLAIVFTLAAARADDYEKSEQAANARHANNFLKEAYGRP